MKRSKIVLIASVFTLAVGSAFAFQSNKTTTQNYKDDAGCPNITLSCPSTTGTLCAHIFLDENCTIQARKP